MHLEDIAAEIAIPLGTLPGMRVPAWGIESVEAPAALVALPERMNYDETYGRGSDAIPDLPLVVLIGAPEDRASRKRLSAYADGTGPQSVKQVLEAYAWTTCDDVHVAYVEFDQTVSYAGVSYLAAIFHLDITGGGS